MVKDIITILNGKTYNAYDEEKDYEFAFASDLMSDCLALINKGCLLITGLVNIQSIRTAEMLDLDFIIFVRGKEPTPEMIEMANQHHISLMSTAYTMYEACGKLYQSGIKAVM